ncbi:MAG: saccharopine dehydrogenase NADP-binding domain-containing protein [Phenylobacterium sp.]|nr:saccharopine dehydrogenase NADP-binding domain-containing protein [Phenylobacterium sp.]MBP8247466.1 saccharopine dehydrogenase NADP-binding domain-containing protein [Phenylobacterium sp.]
MRRIVVIGGGKIGGVIAQMLVESGDYAVTLVDRSPAALQAVILHPRLSTCALDVTDAEALDAALTGAFAVLSAAPFHLTGAVARAAARVGCHYLDLTEDVATTRMVKALAAGAKSAFIPQCGLAPGFISIAGADLARGFDRVEELRLRVGALPRYPSNSLGYNLTWSTEGVINEYCEPCEALVDGELRQVPALEGLETFSLDGVAYEAFNTSGGLGSLAEVLAGKALNLNYKSIRYPGHCALMRTLLNDLNLRHRRDLLQDVLEGAVPGTEQDVVVFFVTASGWRNGRLMQESYAGKVLGEHHGKGFWSAIQVTTAAGICTVLDLLAAGRLPSQGYVRQEEIALADVLSNRFGKAYRQPGDVVAEAPVAAVA